MEIEIVTFGKIADFMLSQHLILTEITDTDGLTIELEKSFPALKHMKYKLAVNKKIIQENTPLANNDSVAIMPPFSGG